MVSLPTPYSPCPPSIPPLGCLQIRQLQGSLFTVPTAPRYSMPPIPHFSPHPVLFPSPPTDPLPVHHPLLSLPSPLFCLDDTQVQTRGTPGKATILSPVRKKPGSCVGGQCYLGKHASCLRSCCNPLLSLHHVRCPPHSTGTRHGTERQRKNIQPCAHSTVPAFQHPAAPCPLPCPVPSPPLDITHEQPSAHLPS